MTVTFFSIAWQTGRRIGAGRRVWGTAPSHEIATAITLTDTNSTVQPGISSISEAVVLRFVGDSDRWMPQTGGQLSLLSPLAGNGLALWPDLFANGCEPRVNAPPLKPVERTLDQTAESARRNRQMPCRNASPMGNISLAEPMDSDPGLAGL